MNLRTKLFSLFLLATFLGAGISTYTHALDMTSDHHHAGDCPLIEGHEELCSATPISHLSLWQRATATSLEIFGYLLLILSGFVTVSYLFRFFADNHSPPRKAVQRTFKAQLPVNLYTRIFSDGILNPKTP